MALILLMVSMLKASAYDFEVDGLYYNILSEEDLTCELTMQDKQNHYWGDVVVPSSVKYDDRQFTVIGIYGASILYKAEGAFTNSFVTSVSLPNTISYIDEFAFLGCQQLSTVNIPENVSRIGKYAFYDCPKLRSVKIPEGITVLRQATFKNSI